ncbi:MAG: quinone-interacting membrane-bound oxidoreductase complex subunit QmoC [Polyangia bacterium]|jgi:quinone-modifying oxidoreductase subunit QmoC|nr:quinone-interacting membrane-bound oxidoreductase complex subunit QmoC [Polyangia bacterium]
MTQPTRIEPDLAFIREVIACGGDSIKSCYQCASCSVSCAISPDDSPFPRKEMLWAQWGQKDRLLEDPDLWLCHNCGDCTRHCPRGARPGEVMSALRQISTASSSPLPFLARWVGSPRFLPLLFAIPAALLLALMGAAGTLRLPEGEVVFSKLVPVWPVVDILFPLTALFALLSSILGIRRLWTGFVSASRRSAPMEPASRPQGPKGVALPGSILAAALEVLRHRTFKDCGVEGWRRLAHLGLFWGFGLLFVTTLSVGVSIYLFGADPPYSMGNPIKWIGNAGGAALILGSLVAIWKRSAKKREGEPSSYSDWLFLWVLFSTGMTGFGAQFLRLADWAIPAYSMYLVHLLLVWFLIAYLPYSKFSHLLYRTTALVFAAHSGRQPRRSR